MSEKYLAAIHLSAPLRKSFEYEYNEVTDSVMRRIENSLTKLHFNFKVRSFASVSQFLSLYLPNYLFCYNREALFIRRARSSLGIAQ